LTPDKTDIVIRKEIVSKVLEPRPVPDFHCVSESSIQSCH